jgi:glycosyltransferase involved in cell wall biosynthesis
MRFSFLILTWNRFKFLEICIGALIKSIDRPATCEIVVMDNGSTDETPEVLSRYWHNKLVKVIQLTKNDGLEAYKHLFNIAKGEYLVEIDDDVLEFPRMVDNLFLDYMQTFPQYGYLALNVIQNEFTSGAKPGPEHYTEETVNGRTIEKGPTGGWCTCFRKADYSKVKLDLMLTTLSMKEGEDGFLSGKLKEKLGLESGIIKSEFCFHACGPYYAKQYGHLDREIEKYATSGMEQMANQYRNLK